MLLDPAAADAATGRSRRWQSILGARFQAYGCGPTLAACSAGTEVAAGAALEELARIGEDRIEDAVGGLPAERRHAAVVVARALQAAARDAMARREVH
jgi:NifU-like protein involved in Fe-S cluster formation